MFLRVAKMLNVRQKNDFEMMCTSVGYVKDCFEAHNFEFPHEYSKTTWSPYYFV